MNEVIHGDSFELLPTLAMIREPFHGIITDPPYGLGSWDWIKNSDQLAAWHQEWAAKALDVVYPGAHMAVFSGTRHFHHMMLAVEAAGWELRDTLIWLKAGGMPKSHNRGPFGTGLKPGWEPIALFRKPLDGTIFATFDKYETGMLHIDAARIPTTDAVKSGGLPTPNSGYADWNIDTTRLAEVVQRKKENAKKAEELGRWPANVVLDLDAAEELDLQTGHLRSGKGGRARKGRNGSAYGDEAGAVDRELTTYGDSGGASRFFFCAKASPGERDAGLENLPTQRYGQGPQAIADIKRGTDPTTTKSRSSGLAKIKEAKNTHPTVKPIKLMQWLNRMLIIPGGRLLDPFAGSGSTGCAAVCDGFEFEGIEQDLNSAAIANARIQYWASLRAKLDRTP